MWISLPQHHQQHVYFTWQLERELVLLQALCDVTNKSLDTKNRNIEGINTIQKTQYPRVYPEPEVDLDF